jgi:hypothetical protein
MDSVRAKEVLLELDKPSPVKTPFGYFGIVFTLKDLEEVLTCVEAFENAQEKAPSLEVQVHECPWPGEFYYGDVTDHDPRGMSLAVQEMLVGDFVDTRVSFEVDPAGNLVDSPEEKSFVGVQWRAYDPSSGETLHSRPLSVAVLEALVDHLSSGED